MDATTESVNYPHSSPLNTPHAEFTADQSEQFWKWITNNPDVHILQLTNNTPSPNLVLSDSPTLTEDKKLAAQNSKHDADQFLSFNSATEFVTELIRQQAKVSKLAITVADSEVLVWAEVQDEDYTSLQSVLRAASIVNARADNVCTVSATVVEESDNLEVPAQYRPIIDNPSLVA